MSKKVKLAIFDGDLKARTVKKYDVSDSGDKIKVKSGGEGHFMPSFDNDSFIEFPYRALTSFWRISWDRIYFVRKGSKTCVNFETEEAGGPDAEVVLEAAKNTILQNLGTEKTETPMISYITLALVVIVLLYVAGVIV